MADLAELGARPPESPPTPKSRQEALLTTRPRSFNAVFRVDVGTTPAKAFINLWGDPATPAMVPPGELPCCVLQHPRGRLSCDATDACALAPRAANEPWRIARSRMPTTGMRRADRETDVGGGLRATRGQRERNSRLKRPRKHPHRGRSSQARPPFRGQAATPSELALPRHRPRCRPPPPGRARRTLAPMARGEAAGSPPRGMRRSSASTPSQPCAARAAGRTHARLRNAAL